MTTPLYTDDLIDSLLMEIWLEDDRLLTSSFPAIRKMIGQMRDRYEDEMEDRAKGDEELIRRLNEKPLAGK